MNKKIRLLEIMLSELVSERDTLEMDLNNTLNGTYKSTHKQKEKFSLVLEKIVGFEISLIKHYAILHGFIQSFLPVLV